MTLQDLKQCRAARYEIESMKERIERLRSAMESCTAKPQTPAGGFGGDATDKLGEQFARLDELESQLLCKLEELESRLQTVDRALQSLPEQQALILRLRYMDGLRWQTVAKRSGYSIDRCFAIHREALKRQSL